MITGVPREVGEEEIRERMDTRGGPRVGKVTRMKRGQQKEISETVVVEFEGEILPTGVFMGHMCFFVRAFIPLPLRCFNCQASGHTAQGCKGKRRCPRCAGEHKFGECPEDAQP